GASFIYTDGGHNLSTDNSCPAAILADPVLGPLEGNGGPEFGSPGTGMLTMALRFGSPAVNQVPATNCYGNDQRGVQDPPGQPCDIGAVQQITFLSCPNNTIATVGQSYSSSISASGGVTPYGYLINRGLPDGLSLNSSTGVIGGTPGHVGQFNFRAEVYDS